MPNQAIIFPGQGSQSVGMGKYFYENFDDVKKIFERADNTLNFKLSKIILDGPGEDLKLTKHTQPAILTVSYSIFETIKKEIDLSSIKYLAGHSLGEYSALVCSKSISFEEAVKVVFERGKAMQDAVPNNKGGMLAILGTELEEISTFIKNSKAENEICEIANDNAPGQIIVSGNINSINELKNLLKKNGKKSISLPVSAPFHCSLMKEAALKMEKKLDLITFKKPEFKIISNVTASIIENHQNIKKLLVEQIYNKVRWRESIINISKKGITDFIEIGPGKVLSGLVKRIIKGSNTMSINSVDEIKRIIDEFKK